MQVGKDKEPPSHPAAQVEAKRAAQMVQKRRYPGGTDEWLREAIKLSQETIKLSAERSILAELIKVLTPHPGGLRRWSVMQAIRKHRENATREVPPKFEDQVERTFRRFCTDENVSKTSTSEDALFYRPKDKAGEVWAIYPDRVRTWLAEVQK